VEDRERAQQRTEEPGIQSPTQFRTREEARFFILNLIKFQLHTILEIGDRDFREARKYTGRRDFLVFISAEDDLK
jgi:hypothetical protein